MNSDTLTRTLSSRRLRPKERIRAAGTTVCLQTGANRTYDLSHVFIHFDKKLCLIIIVYFIPYQLCETDTNVFVVMKRQ